MLLGFAPLLAPGLILLALGIVLIAIARFWPERAPVVTAVEPVERVPLGEPATVGAVTAFARTITWPVLVDADAGSLSPSERRRVIDGLGIVGDAWAAGILAQAFDEEQGELRLAAIEALGSSETDAVVPTLARAYASYVVAERYAAIDGAARHGDLELLERGLRDTDGTVALAAAYGLHRAGRGDLIEAGLGDRDDARANEIRRIIPLLAGV